MNIKNKAVAIQLANFSSPQMRAFHMSWMAFFLCFFGWFGLSPMLGKIRDDLGITTDQIVTTNMVAVGSTIFMRLIIGWLCDRYGPRLTYTWLLLLGAFPVMGVGLSEDYTTFLVFRMFIGAIGASFVITQFHTTLMFAPNCVGTANAVSAGWGNLGGGVTLQVMPFVFTAAMMLFAEEQIAWRVAMIVPGFMMLIMGAAYFFLTQDTPNGSLKELRNKGETSSKKTNKGSFSKVIKDYRVWLLFFIYGACFGIELTINAKATLYFIDYYEMDIKTAGIIAGLFGLMNLFARPLGGIVGDKFGIKGGLKGRTKWLFITLVCEGIALMIFSRMGTIPTIIVSLIIFSIFVQMSEGATFSLVPFIDKKNIGIVSGIVGAGGNTGAVCAMFLFKKDLTGLAWNDSFLILGIIVTAVSSTALLIKFSAAAENETKLEIDAALAARKKLVAQGT